MLLQSSPTISGGLRIPANTEYLDAMVRGAIAQLLCCGRPVRFRFTLWLLGGPLRAARAAACMNRRRNNGISGPKLGC